MKIEIEPNITHDQLATIFINWGSDEQANFLNIIGRQFKNADWNAEGQCCWIADDINKDGKDFLYTMSNFVKVQKFTMYSKHFGHLINTYETDGLHK